MGQKSEVKFRVRYHETDQMGIVYHANYLNWFEVGRTEWLRQSGITYRDIEESGLLLPVIEVGCKYYLSAKYDDLIQVETSILSFNKVRLLFSYKITRVQDEQLLVDGFTEHVFLNEERQIIRLDKVRPQLATIIRENASHT